MRLLRYEIMRLFGYDFMRPYTRIHVKLLISLPVGTTLHRFVPSEKT